jgi:hypothetical protein
LRSIIFILFCLFAILTVKAQNVSLPEIHINGKVVDPKRKDPDLTNFMVVNLRTQNGFFGKADGSFSIDINRRDTFVVAVTGYDFRKFCYKDSAAAPQYNLTVILKEKEIRLPEVRIIAPRELSDIERDIQRLGYSKKDYEISGINALESPITFLYEEFSRIERLKRHNAELVNDDKRRQLLKELLARYVADDIIELSNVDFDRFVDFCNVSEEFMKRATQYEFMVYIKGKYELFSGMNDYYRERTKEEKYGK